MFSDLLKKRIMIFSVCLLTMLWYGPCPYQKKKRTKKEEIERRIIVVASNGVNDANHLIFLNDVLTH